MLSILMLTPFHVRSCTVFLCSCTYGVILFLTWHRYDVAKEAEEDEQDGAAEKGKGKGKGPQEGARQALFKDDPTYADELAAKMKEQLARNRAEFAQDDPEQRLLYEGCVFMFWCYHNGDNSNDDDKQSTTGYPKR